MKLLLASGFSIEGPSQAKIECDDKGDGSCDVRYWPTEPGDYAVHVICDDEDIKDSPFMAHVLPAATDALPENVRMEPLRYEDHLARRLPLKEPSFLLRSNVLVQAWSHWAASSTNQLTSSLTPVEPAEES